MSDETAKLLTRWLDKAKITDGFVFRKLSPKQTVQKEPMQYQALLRRYEAIGMAINAEGKFTCHSTRTGGVLTLMEADVPMAEIVLSGNWKSEAMASAECYQARYFTTEVRCFCVPNSSSVFISSQTLSAFLLYIVSGFRIRMTSFPSVIA